MDEADFLNRRLGQTLCGKWTLERLLGWGGMAAVYVGVHKIGRRDAIKILHEEVAISPETRGRFEQEAYAVNHLGHPGAVEVRDIDVTDEGCPFLVMELLEGESLAALLEKGELETSVMLGYVDQVLDVLVAAHANGIVHRDIKPDNLFVCETGRVKVLDFGVARMKEGAPRTLATRTGMAVGTLTYMAPEQVRGIHVDGRSDLFAVGATMFRCIARRRIHDGNTDADLLIKMATLPAPAIRSVAPNTPPDLAMVVDRALQFESVHRYPDARTMQSDIRALMRGEPPLYALASGSTAAPEPSRLVAPAMGPMAVPSGIDATRAEVPRQHPAGVARTAPMVEPPASTPGVAPTVVDGVTAVPSNRDPKSKAPMIALLGASAVVVLLLLAVVAVAGWALFGSDDGEGIVSADRNELPTELEESLADGTVATATGMPAGDPTATKVLPGTPPTAGTAVAGKAAAGTAAATPPTGFVPPSVPPPAIPTTVISLPGIPPPATATSPSKKEKGKGKGKDKHKGKDDD